MDKRVSARNRVLKVGTIEFEGGSINCMVRNLSNTGAALALRSIRPVPDGSARSNCVHARRSQRRN